MKGKKTKEGLIPLKLQSYYYYPYKEEESTIITTHQYSKAYIFFVSYFCYTDMPHALTQYKVTFQLNYMPT
jgi:hypothetical protein